MLACCRFVILRHTYTCLFHSDLLTAGRGWEVNLDATLRHTDTPFLSLTHTQALAVQSQDASACGRLPSPSPSSRK